MKVYKETISEQGMAGGIRIEQLQRKMWYGKEEDMKIDKQIDKQGECACVLINHLNIVCACRCSLRYLVLVNKNDNVLTHGIMCSLLLYNIVCEILLYYATCDKICRDI